MALDIVEQVHAGKTTRLVQLSFGRTSNDEQSVSVLHSAMWGQLAWRTGGLQYEARNRVEEMEVAHSVAAMRTVEVTAAEQGIDSAVGLSTGMLQVERRRNVAGCGGSKSTVKLGVRASSRGPSGEGERVSG